LQLVPITKSQLTRTEYSNTHQIQYEQKSQQRVTWMMTMMMTLTVLESMHRTHWTECHCSC